MKLSTIKCYLYNDFTIYVACFEVAGLSQRLRLPIICALDINCKLIMFFLWNLHALVFFEKKHIILRREEYNKKHRGQEVLLFGDCQ